jgi:hypothetical protein
MESIWIKSGLRGACVCTAIVLCAAATARAQDTNYWTLQYGTRGELLGGVVVGSAVDLSATFYNPGSLALIIDPSTILTATVFGMENIKLSDEDPDQEALSSRTIGPEPSLFAGSIPADWLGGRWAYSFLTRQKLDFRLTAREGAVIALDTPGDTLSIGGEVVYEQYLGEQWGGLTWSRRATEKIGYGVTLFGVYRSQRRSQRQTVEAFGPNGYGSSLLDWTDIEYFTARVLAKAGISADFGNTTLGLAFTTRSLQVMGNGTILINRVVVGDTDLDGAPDSRAEVSHGEDVDADYRSPLSIALGGSYRWTNISVHATAEYFAAIDPYTVMEAPKANDSPGVTGYPSNFQHALNDVLNWGVGVEKRFSEKTTAYISFITDYSASRPVEPHDISVSLERRRGLLVVEHRSHTGRRVRVGQGTTARHARFRGHPASHGDTVRSQLLAREGNPRYRAVTAPETPRLPVRTRRSGPVSFPTRRRLPGRATFQEEREAEREEEFVAAPILQTQRRLLVSVAAAQVQRHDIAERPA